MISLSWLPKHADASAALKQIKTMGGDPQKALTALRALVKHDLDFIQTTNADRRLQALRTEIAGPVTGLTPLKFAILASTTVDHLLPALRVAALRRGLLLECYLSPYNQYRQELLNPASGLFSFHPDAVLLALDSYEAGVALPLESTMEDVERAARQRVDEWARYWDIVKTQLRATMIQQTIVEPPLSLFGHFDALVPGTPATILHMLNDRLHREAREKNVLLFDLERLASHMGKAAWCDFPLWHHAKQAVSPTYGPLYGDSLAAILAGLRGRSAKCLVLDLDNTLWGGVIGDDGLAGIEIGQGTGRSEAHYAFQHYVKQLKERGVILAICSKNDETNALLPFANHPEMLLRRDDFAAVMANWESKAANIERLALQLNISLDTMVFFDDNPAERALVRQFLPDVWVPEVPEDPALYAACLSNGHYFEATAFTADDTQRAAQYQANAQRTQLRGKSHDLDSFLRGLQMEMDLSAFDDVGVSRITQLINKSNQFNLTTRRYTEAQVAQMKDDPALFTFQARLKDNCGDNGMISVLIAKALETRADTLVIDTWLMSCRVLGRQVEQEILNQLVDQARQKRFKTLRGVYIPTEKNCLVCDHYKTLGFTIMRATSEADKAKGVTRWELDLESFQHISTHISVHFKGKVAL